MSLLSQFYPQDGGSGGDGGTGILPTSGGVRYPYVEATNCNYLITSDPAASLINVGTTTYATKNSSWVVGSGNVTVLTPRMDAQEPSASIKFAGAIPDEEIRIVAQNRANDDGYFPKLDVMDYSEAPAQVFFWLNATEGITNHKVHVNKVVMPSIVVNNLGNAPAPAVIDFTKNTVGTIDASHMNFVGPTYYPRQNTLLSEEPLHTGNMLFSNSGIDADGIESFLVKLNDNLVNGSYIYGVEAGFNIKFDGCAARSTWSAACEAAATNLTSSFGFIITNS